MLSSLRQNKAESESETGSESSKSWEDRMLAGLASLRKNPSESKIETSTSWEERMLVREAGGRISVGGRRKEEEDEEQREKEVT